MLAFDSNYLNQDNTANQDLEEEDDTEVEVYATMAEQIEKTRLAGMQNMFSSDSSEEEEEVNDGLDIFADDMALGEEASTLDSHASKPGEKKQNKIPGVLLKKDLRKPFKKKQKRQTLTATMQYKNNKIEIVFKR